MGGALWSPYLEQWLRKLTRRSDGSRRIGSTLSYLCISCGEDASSHVGCFA